MISYFIRAHVAKKLKQKVHRHPEVIREVFTHFDQRNRHIPDAFLDSLLGLTPDDVEKRLDYRHLEARYGNEQYVYEGTPYDYARRFLHVLKPVANDTIYDLGSGYGRLVFYGALTTPATYIGIEVVPERVAAAERIRAHFNITNVQFVSGNVLEQDYRNGTAFFLFNPFTDQTIADVLDALKEIHNQRPITIGVWGGGGTHQLAGERWLREVPLKEDYITIGPTGLKIYTSRGS